MKHLNDKRINPSSWPIKALVAAVAVATLGSSIPAHTATTVLNRKPIGDLEIYAPATPGTATIFMMLDTSGSMDKGSIRDDYGNRYSSECSEQAISSAAYKAVVYNRKDKLGVTGEVIKDEDGQVVRVIDFDNERDTFNIIPKGCTANNITRYSRMERLKLALIELLADRIYSSNDSVKETGSLPDDYEIGLGSFSGALERIKVRVPTKPLNSDQRAKLIEEILSIKALGGTPTALSLAESGAYMMGTKAENNAFNRAVDSAKSGNSYISPLSAKECSGNGIYLLTDGAPNGASGRTEMNNSLSDSPNNLRVSSECRGLPGRTEWGCMAEYSALLRNPASNSKGLPIKTATVGFGKDFEGLTGTRSIIINGKTKEVVNCDSGSFSKDRYGNATTAEINTRNLCKLGERRGDNEVKTFGDGGFYYTEESAEIAASIVDFASGLITTIDTAPSGTITIPEDPYRASNQLPYAYLPMLDPDIGSAASTWRGNLKKFKLNNGTLYGQSNSLLYKDVSGELSSTTQDLWQTGGDFKVENVVVNNNISAGGVYAQLRSPDSGLNSVRTIYVEDHTSDTDTTPILRKLSVSGGSPQGFGDLKDTATYTQLNKRRLLSFLGFDGLLTKDGQPTSATDVEDITLTAPTEEIKVLGGVVHSTPEALSYESRLDANGRIIDPRDDYVLFGSMDGALHLVDADNGQETFAVIPKLMLETQPKALVSNSIKAEIGQPYFGVDAPWLVATDYKYNLFNDDGTAVTNQSVTVDTAAGKGMFAYGGLRMGGEAFYGMDITKKSDPKILFTITPQGVRSSTSSASSTTGFGRLGQVWSKPVRARIRLAKGSDTTKNAAPTDVLIFGGGYDMRYEDDSYVPTSNEPAKGNAIYMIDAKTGKLLWSMSNSGTSKKTGDNKYDVDSKMIHSITGGITVLDRDNDGLIDHLYAADLGGQVFRVDFENARNAQFGFSEVSNFANKGVTRILNVAPSNSAYKQLAYRFYESPVVSFYRREGGTDNGKLFALVNVISGNRSAPLSKIRNDNTYANRVYGIIDSDITESGLYTTGFTSKVKDLTENNLVNLASSLGAAPTAAKKQEIQNLMIGVAASTTTAATLPKNGWYYPLTRFDGYNNVRHNKGMGPSVVINNLLYTTVYNPDKVYGNVASCAAKISGGSERQLYCLPYGICTDATSITGTGGFVPAGQGIQELALGAYNEDNTDIKVLIGTTTITERIAAANRAGYGTDAFKNDSNIKDLYPGEGNSTTQDIGDGSATEYLFNERYTLQPRAWYEQKPIKSVVATTTP